MDAFMEEFQHLKIQLKDLQSATDNFGENNVIGRGGFGNVYKGAISHKEQSIVAIKRLNQKHGQGKTEFWREITMLSRYTHENLVSLVGFCDEGGEKILVYEHAYYGSLDTHLSSTSLTWTQRIKICLDAARGLSYLHDDKRGTQQRVLHRDIKSSNILLDKNWTAKVSDMGLSKIGPSNQQHTVIVTDAVGTFGYVDPLYMETGILSKESDVYSFGVVLFEVMCGRLCFEKSNGRILVHTWKQSYNENKLANIIFKDIMHQMYSESLKIFSDIAFQSLQESRLVRPTMSHVVEKLKSALEIQEWLAYYEDITRNVVPPLQYRSKAELSILLSKGVLLNGGKTWFSLDDNGKHCEMISIAECLITYDSENVESQYSPDVNSRFPYGTYSPTWDFRTRVSTQFLSPLTQYMVNLVFKCLHKDKWAKQQYIYIHYKLQGCTYVSNVPLSVYILSEDEWLKAGLCEFTTNESSIVDLEFTFAGHMYMQDVKVEGIEFVPIKKVEHKVVRRHNILIYHEEGDTTSPLDTNWEQILSNGYKEILKWSDDIIQWRTKKELYDVLCKGFLMNNGQEWFFLNKNGKRCLMLSAKACAATSTDTTTIHEKTSRFREEAVRCCSDIQIVWRIRSQVLSPETTYATYLVYQPENSSGFKSRVRVIDNHLSPDDWYIYLRSPQVPEVGDDTYKPLRSPKLPQRRSDGWMEVQVWEFQTGTTTKIIPISLQLKIDSEVYSFSFGKIFVDDRLSVLGIEFRPK